MINILIVEDHPIITEGIKYIIAEEKDIFCAGCYVYAKDLLDKLKVFVPDVIVMDINLPDANGINLCKEVKEKYPDIFIVALSINNEAGIINKMIQNGANGYVLKDAAQQEIVEAIRTVSKGKEYLSHNAALSLRQKNNTTLAPLTRREKEVLEKIAEGLTNQQIAELLFLDITTIKSHRKNMLAKYNVQNTAALIKLAITEKLI